MGTVKMNSISELRNLYTPYNPTKEECEAIFDIAQSKEKKVRGVLAWEAAITLAIGLWILVMADYLTSIPKSALFTAISIWPFIIAIDSLRAFNKGTISSANIKKGNFIIVSGKASRVSKQKKAFARYMRSEDAVHVLINGKMWVECLFPLYAKVLKPNDECVVLITGSQAHCRIYAIPVSIIKATVEEKQKVNNPYLKK